MAAVVSLANHTAKIIAPANHWSKRPRPIVKLAAPADLNWDPVAMPLFTVDADGATCRAGDASAIVRPGVERWPLGIVSDVYRVTPHRATAASVVANCSDLVTANGVAISGHGYHVAHGYHIRHMQGGSVNGAPLTAKLVVENDHTGEGSLGSSLVVYVAGAPLGSIVRRRAIHVGDQPFIWHAEVESMIEKAILAQDALLDLLRVAQAHVMTDDDRKFFQRRKMVIKDKRARTALDAVKEWHEGHTRRSNMTWGVWSRRLDDTAIVALCALLGRDRFGAPLDAVLGGHRYGNAR